MHAEVSVGVVGVDAGLLAGAVRQLWRGGGIGGGAVPLGDFPDVGVGPVTDHPLWEVVRWLPAQRWYAGQISVDHGALRYLDPELMPGLHGLGLERNWLAMRTCWGIPSPADLAWLLAVLGGRGVVECGAGSGYWAWQLAQCGIDVAAFDVAPGDNEYVSARWHPVRVGDARVVTADSSRVLLLCWPPPGDPMAHAALSRYTGTTLIYCGEPVGGACADAAFFAALHRGWQQTDAAPAHATWTNTRCQLTLWNRR